MVEMAGIEPASARLEHRTSTSVEGLQFHNSGEKPSNILCCYPLEPESSLSSAPRSRKRHSSFVSPVQLPAGERSWQTWPLLAIVLSLIAYAAKGRAAKLVRLALKLCTDFTRSVPLGSPFGISLFRRSLSSPIGLYYTHPL